MSRSLTFSGLAVGVGLLFATAANAGWFISKKPKTPENWPGPGLYRYDVEVTMTTTTAGVSHQMHSKRDGATGIQTNWQEGQPPYTEKSEPLNLCIQMASTEMLAAGAKLSNQCRATVERPAKAYDEYAFSCPDGMSATMIAKRTGPKTWELADETRTDAQGAIAGGGMLEMRRSLEAVAANLPPDERKKLLAQLPSEAEARAQDAKLQAEAKRSAADFEAKMADMPPEQRAAMQGMIENMRAGRLPTGGPQTVTKSVWRYTKISDTCTGAP